jgi:hypothetical protein
VVLLIVVAKGMGVVVEVVVGVVIKVGGLHDGFPEVDACAGGGFATTDVS